MIKRERIKQYWHNYYVKNKDVLNANGKKWYNKNKNKAKDNDLKRNFGITLQEYNKFLSKQKGRCAICAKPESNIDKRTNNIRRLCVDHSHDNKKVRGLLCGKCNMALGLLNDDIRTIKKIVRYLQKTRSGP